MYDVHHLQPRGVNEARRTFRGTRKLTAQNEHNITYQKDGAYTAKWSGVLKQWDFRVGGAMECDATVTGIKQPALTMVMPGLAFR